MSNNFPNEFAGLVGRQRHTAKRLKHFSRVADNQLFSCLKIDWLCLMIVPVTDRIEDDNAMKKCLELSVGIAAFLIFAGMNLSFYAVANAVEVELDTGEIIELDDAVVQRCSEEGLNLGACACVVSIMLDETGTTSLSLEQMIQLATDYPEEYGEAKGHCKSVN